MQEGQEGDWQLRKMYLYLKDPFIVCVLAIFIEVK